MRNPLKELYNANDAVEHSIDRLEFEGRSAVSRDVVGYLRHLVEHIAMYATYGNKPIEGDYFKLCSVAIKDMSKNSETRFIAKFHHYLQKVVSHYVPSEDSAERLLLKYYENLLCLKRYAFDKLGLTILANLSKIPLDTDPGLAKYHEEIAHKINDFMSANAVEIEKDRFYVRAAKPFFVGDSVYYEATLVPAFDSCSKFDRILVYSSFRMPTNYSVVVSTKRTSIDGLGFTLPVTIVDAYAVSVRPCELNNLIKILRGPDAVWLTGQYTSYRSLMNLMTHTGMTLCDIALLPDDEFISVMGEIASSGNACPVHTLLSSAHEFLSAGSNGSNVLKYLLSKPRNRVIEEQLTVSPNSRLGDLYLKNGCAPFDRQPYCTSLIGHVVAVEDLYQCIDPDPYEDNFLARRVTAETIDSNALYLRDTEITTFSDVDELIASFNSALYFRHHSRDLVHENGHLFVKGVEDELTCIIRGLLKLSGAGVKGYTALCESWLKDPSCKLDDSEKIDALKSMFAETSVAFIYGSAGTGKTTMVNIVCAFLQNESKLAIANTNPAVDSLRRKINDKNCEFMTVAKYLNRVPDCDILIVDECSTVCNSDMKSIIDSNRFKLLLLVGDVRQIESIKTTKTTPADNTLQRMVDREAKRAEGKGVGYDRWAAKHNLKQMAATVTAYQQYGFSSPEELDEACSAAYTAMRESLTELKQMEKTLNGKKELQRQVLAYSKTRPVRDGLKQQKNAKAKAAYRQKYESDFIIADAAARYFRENGISKLPSYKALQAEIETLIQEKNSGYNDYRAKREEYRRLQTVKGNIDQILHRERKPVKRQEQER